jgi:hypothetical protein
LLATENQVICKLSNKNNRLNLNIKIVSGAFLNSVILINIIDIIPVHSFDKKKQLKWKECPNIIVLSVFCLEVYYHATLCFWEGNPTKKFVSTFVFTVLFFPYFYNVWCFNVNFTCLIWRDNIWFKFDKLSIICLYASHYLVTQFSRNFQIT